MKRTASSLSNLTLRGPKGSILHQDRPQHCPQKHAVAHDIQDLQPPNIAGEQYPLFCGQDGLAELYRAQGQPR
jgi:hypothetical protein